MSYKWYQSLIAVENCLNLVVKLYVSMPEMILELQVEHK